MQFGFIKGKSTIDAIREVVNTAKRSMERRHFCAIITLDIKNAFYSADWNEIRSVIRRRNISGYLVKMIDSYLENRTLIYDTDTGAKNIKRPTRFNIGPFSMEPDV